MLRRAALALVAAAQAEVGVWGEISPRGFFDHFPAIGGQHWVRAFGHYNEHLVRDFAAAELGFAVLLAAAAVWLERRLVMAAGTAFLIFTAAHFAFHLGEHGSLTTSADVVSLSSFAIEMEFVAAVTAATALVPDPPPERSIDATTAVRKPARG